MKFNSNRWYSNRMSKPNYTHHIGTKMNGGKVIGIGPAPKRNYPEGVYAYVVFPDRKAEYVRLDK